MLITKRFVFGGDVAGSDTVSSGGIGKYFALSDVPGYGEFQALFDQYQIVGISYRWVCVRSPESVTTAANKGIYPRVLWAHDHDSAQTPVSFNEIQQYPKAREMYFTADKSCTRWYYVKTAVASMVYQGVTASAYTAKWKAWIDSTYPNTQHYGIRAFYSELYAGNTMRLECRYHMKFKSVI